MWNEDAQRIGTGEPSLIHPRDNAGPVVQRQRLVLTLNLSLKELYR